MIISYDEFCSILSKKIQDGEDFYVSLLEKVIDNPTRYCGLFRLSNARTKLIQNVTQSREIKFGDIIEEICTLYIDKLGYKNFNKHLGKNENGDDLNVDQYFTDGTNVFLTEMKIRDDHDSTKKRGQYDNFRKKISLVRKQHPNAHIDASMWFVDPGLIKNKNYYRDEMSKENFSNVSLHLYYGSEFFASLNNGMTVWNELISLLKEYRLDNADTNVEIPDFGISEEIYNALLHISSKHWKKLNSELEEIVQLRAELFSNGDNLEKALKKRPL